MWCVYNIDDDDIDSIDYENKIWTTQKFMEKSYLPRGKVLGDVWAVVVVVAVVGGYLFWIYRLTYYF